MKKFLLIILFTVYMLTIATGSFAKSDLTPTPTVSESNKSEALNEQINNLKTRIASRVAQLKLVEKRGVIGTVTDVTDTQITISDLKNNTRFVDVDELTRFSSPGVKGSFGISDISKGTTLAVLGLYNKESRRILARFVNVLALSKIIHGIVSSVDKENYALKVLTDNREMSFDVETSTKTISYAKDSGLIRSGFSKIKERERVIIIAESDSKDKDKFVALKIILLPEIAKNLNSQKTNAE